MTPKRYKLNLHSTLQIRWKATIKCVYLTENFNLSKNLVQKEKDHKQ